MHTSGAHYYAHNHKRDHLPSSFSIACCNAEVRPKMMFEATPTAPCSERELSVKRSAVSGCEASGSVAVCWPALP